MRPWKQLAGAGLAAALATAAVACGGSSSSSSAPMVVAAEAPATVHAVSGSQTLPLGLQFEADGGDVILTVTTSGFGLFGMATALGDFNGNDRLDLAVGLPSAWIKRETPDGAFLGSNRSGAVLVFQRLATGDLATAAPLLVLPEEDRADDLRFGASLAAADVRGDGRDELLIGAPRGPQFELPIGDGGDFREEEQLAASTASPTRIEQGGVVYLAFFSDEEPPLDADDRVVTARRVTASNAATGFAEGDLLGFSIAAGDLNASGRADVVAGAPGTTPLRDGDEGPALPFAGAVWTAFLDVAITSGEEGSYNLDAIDGGNPIDLEVAIDGGTIEAISFADTDFTDFASVSAWEVAQHLNDEFDRLDIKAIATEVRNRVQIRSLSHGADAAVHVVGGDANDALGFATDAATGADSARPTAHMTRAAELLPEPGALFGYSVATGNVTGDDHDEVIVGAPLASSIGSLFDLSGEVHVLSHRGTAVTVDTVDIVSDGLPLGLFGFSVAAGDVTGDGLADVVVGAPFATIGFLQDEGFAGSLVEALSGRTKDELLSDLAGSQAGGGEVLIYRSEGGQLSRDVTMLTPEIGGSQRDGFGWRVALARIDATSDALDIIASAPFRGLTSLTGGEVSLDAWFLESGEVFVFRKGEGTRRFATTRLGGVDIGKPFATYPLFGLSLSAREDHVAVGAPMEVVGSLLLGLGGFRPGIVAVFELEPPPADPAP